MLPHGVGFFHDKFTVFLFATFPIRVDFLQNIICEAVVKSCDNPVTPNETERRSLIEGLLDTHLGTLRETLQGTQTYIKKFKAQTRREGRGEKLSTYEYQIDLKKLDAIVRKVRLQEDVKLICQSVRRSRFVSIRYVQKYIITNYGQAWSSRRITQALEYMLDAGIIQENRTTIRRYGREVLEA